MDPGNLPQTSVPASVGAAETEPLTLDAALRAARAQLDNLNAISKSADAIDALRLLADTLPQIVWITRADGFHEYYNRRWWEYAGLTYEQSTGDGWLTLLHPDDIERSRARWTHSLSTGEAYEIEYRLRRASDGEYRWFLGRAIAYHDSSGQIVRWFGTCTDIHDQKMAAEALRHAKEQTDANSRAKDEFLAVLSHELRTPLSAILGWVQLIEMGVLDEKEQSEAIRTIKEQAKVQSQLIEDLLEVSRIINGKFHMRDEAVELHQVVSAATEAVRPSAADKGLHFERGVWDESLFVRGDPQRLQQVAWNLLTNAVKFTPAGGTVRISLERVQSGARLTVSDTGKGISPDMLTRIFDRFQQADSSATRSQGGLGLGLSIVKHIVTLHQGTITAHSDGNGKGSTFTVMLPVQAVRPDYAGFSGATSAQISPDALKGAKLLVVDDEESARTVVAACLRKFGADVSVAACVPDALALLQERSFDALISDVAMPLQNGYDLIRMLRTNGSQTRLPAIALTAFASVDDQTRAIEAGFDLHVTKPVEPLDLISRVLRLTHPA